MSDATTAAAASDATTLMGGDATAATSATEATTATAATTTAATAEPTAEEKAAADAAAAAKAADDAAKAAKPEGAPEKYEAFALPETVKLDEPVMNEFSALAKEANLPQATAQKFVDLAAKMQTGTVEGLQAHVEAQSTQWAEASKTDKEFGGDAFAENLAVAKAAMDKFGSPELKSLLETSRLGNHPEVLRFFVRAGKAISQDGFVPGRKGAAEADPAKRMYPSMN